MTRLDPDQFLEVAKAISHDKNQFDHPGWFRSSVSRAYYAAFLFVRKQIQDAGIRISDDYHQHQDVISELNKVDSNLGSILNSLRDHRNDADYQVYQNISNSTSLKCVRLAEIIFSGNPRF